MRRDAIDGKDPSVTVIFVDMDDFKKINDKYGHSEGDKVIIEAGNVLKAGLRETDFIARLGGDEYAIILDEPTIIGEFFVR